MSRPVTIPNAPASSRLVYGLTAVVAAALVALLAWWGLQGEVERCRRIVTRLAQGDPAVASEIDWEQLTAPDLDAGAAYRALTDPRDRRAFQRIFIGSFSAGFEYAQGRSAIWRRWRVVERKEDAVVIAAEHATGKTLLFEMGGLERKRLRSIRWQP